MNIVEPILIQCRNKPAEMALAAPGTELNVVSYGRLLRSIDNFSARIIPFGLQPGQRAAVFVQDPILHAIALLALTRLGVVTVSGRVKDWSWRFAVDAVISDSPHNFQAAKIILIDPTWIAGDGKPIDKRHVYRAAAEDLCRIILTSGTTGQEKGVALSHGVMAARLDRQNVFFGALAPFCARTYLDLSLTTSLGIQVLLGTLWRGGALVMTGDSEATIKALPIYKVQNMVGSPRSLLNFVEAIERRPQYRCTLEGVFSGGSMLSEALSERVRARMCSNLTKGYGSTEAGEVASMPAHFAPDMPNAVGYVMPGVEVQIIDESGNQLLRGKEGIVRIKSGTGVDEYLDDPEESARVFRDGWFHPGDIGYLTKENMLVISGRATSILNLGGEKVNPERVEGILSAHANVVQCAVLAVVNESGGDELCALVVPRSYLDVEALRRHCEASLPSVFVPARFIAVSELPRNEMGKIKRAKLAELTGAKLN